MSFHLLLTSLCQAGADSVYSALLTTRMSTIFAVYCYRSLSAGRRLFGRGDYFCALAISCSVGLNMSWIIFIWLGWIMDLPEKPSCLMNSRSLCAVLRRRLCARILCRFHSAALPRTAFFSPIRVRCCRLNGWFWSARSSPPGLWPLCAGSFGYFVGVPDAVRGLKGGSGGCLPTGRPFCSSSLESSSSIIFTVFSSSTLGTRIPSGVCWDYGRKVVFSSIRCPLMRTET